MSKKLFFTINLVSQGGDIELRVEEISPVIINSKVRRSYNAKSSLVELGKIFSEQRKSQKHAIQS